MKINQKIQNRTAKIGVIGLGYVGLPLAAEFANAGFEVVGIDISEDKVDLIKALLHEYKHYLQPRWGYEFYTELGYEYENHPYELEAIAEESNWKKYTE